MVRCIIFTFLTWIPFFAPVFGVVLLFGSSVVLSHFFLPFLLGAYWATLVQVGLEIFSPLSLVSPRFVEVLARYGLEQIVFKRTVSSDGRVNRGGISLFRTFPVPLHAIAEQKSPGGADIYVGAVPPPDLIDLGITRPLWYAFVRHQSSFMDFPCL